MRQFEKGIRFLKTQAGPVLLILCLSVAGFAIMNEDRKCPPSSLICVRGAAWDQFDESETIDPTLRSARTLFNKGKFREALTHYDSYIASSTDSRNLPAALYESSMILQDQELFDEAIHRLEKVGTAYPQSQLAPKSLLKAGTLRFGLSRFEEANATLERLAQQYPKTPEFREARSLLIDIAFTRGDIPRFVSNLRNFLEAFPKGPKARAVCENFLTSERDFLTRIRHEDRVELSTACDGVLGQ